jgi:amidohydrolase
MLLMAARILSSRRKELAGRVKLMFQPAEESPGGALPMIEVGLLEEPAVDAAFGIHLWNEMPVGQVGIIPGPAMAAVDTVRVTVTGKGGHGAAPHHCADPILASAQIITALQSIVARNIKPIEAGVVTIGALHGGFAENVIPAAVEMKGTIRSFSEANRGLLLARFREIVDGFANAMGCSAAIEHVRGYPSLVNDPEMSELARLAAVAIVGDANVKQPDPTMGGEDFAYVLERVPGCFAFVGSANEERGLNFPHHNPRFDIDEAALPIGVALLVELAERGLAAAAS